MPKKSIDKDKKNYNFMSSHNVTSNFPNSSAYLREVTEPVFTGDESVNYKELTESLEQNYGLDGLSDYEDPQEVRISYQISGSGSEWENILKIEVDEKQRKVEWITESLKSIRDMLERGQIDSPDKIWDAYMSTQKTHVHTYPNKDISMNEMEEFLDQF